MTTYRKPNASSQPSFADRVAYLERDLNGGQIHFNNLVKLAPDLLTCIREQRAALAECTDDLEAEVKSRYALINGHPAMTPKFNLEMAPVNKARAVLARWRIE